jgi:hypothetical protein
MSFTRFHDDPVRIKKQLQESTGAGRYWLETPGPGFSVPFLDDPHIRLQRWGANMRTNTLNLNSDLLGLERKLTHDIVNYSSKTPLTMANVYPIRDTAIVNESRATHPAWMFRDLEQRRWDTLLDNVQEHVEIPFDNQISTRYVERYGK